VIREFVNGRLFVRFSRGISGYARVVANIRKAWSENRKTVLRLADSGTRRTPSRTPYGRRVIKILLSVTPAAVIFSGEIIVPFGSVVVDSD